MQAPQWAAWLQHDLPHIGISSQQQSKGLRSPAEVPAAVSRWRTEICLRLLTIELEGGCEAIQQFQVEVGVLTQHVSNEGLHGIQPLRQEGLMHCSAACHWTSGKQCLQAPFSLQASAEHLPAHIRYTACTALSLALHLVLVLWQVLVGNHH